MLGIALIGVLIATLQTAPMEPQMQGMILSGLGAVGMFLRSITKTAIGAPEPTPSE